MKQNARSFITDFFLTLSLTTIYDNKKNICGNLKLCFIKMKNVFYCETIYIMLVFLGFMALTLLVYQSHIYISQILHTNKNIPYLPEKINLKD